MCGPDKSLHGWFIDRWGSTKEKKKLEKEGSQLFFFFLERPEQAIAE